MFFKSRVKRRKVSRKAFQPEALESRTLLAGDVSVALRGDVVVLTGDAEDNSVEVRPNEDGDATVFGVDGTTVNGSADPFVLSEGTTIGGLRARMREGNDVVRVESLEIDGRFVARGRTGDDAIGLYDTNVARSVFVFTGSGEDSVSLDETTVGRTVLIGTGRDADTIGIDDSRVEGSTLFFTGTGDDRVAVRDSEHEFVNISTSYGDDFVSVDGTDINGLTFAFAGSGDDELSLNNSDFDRRAYVFGSGGEDNLAVNETTFGVDPRVRSVEGDAVETPIERTDAVFLDLVESGARLGTIAEIAILTPQLSTLVDALVAADLVGAVNGTDLLTVFAPTNEAFGKLPDGTLDTLLQDPGGRLTEILTYHVSPGAQDAAAVVGSTTLDTLNGDTIDVTVNDDSVFLDVTSEIIATNIRAKNGFVHLISEVLIPPEAP